MGCGKYLIHCLMFQVDDRIVLTSQETVTKKHITFMETQTNRLCIN